MRHDQTLDGIPGQLWRRTALARHRLLMLDYDGTLAPFTTDRPAALPVPRSMQLVKRIAAGAHTSVAIISGRPLREVEKLVGRVPAVFVGEHGWEQRSLDGGVVRRPLESFVSTVLDKAERVAHSSGWSNLLERKRAGVVLHTRSLPRDVALALQERCAAAWEGFVVDRQMTVDHIDGGIELRARRRNEGTVVLTLLSQCPLGTLGVFVGNGATGADAFEAVRDWGFGILVGDCDRPSLAVGRIPSVEAVPDFLERWLALETGPTRKTS